MAVHGCRAQLWSILGALVLLCMCGTVFTAPRLAQDSSYSVATSMSIVANTLEAEGNTYASTIRPSKANTEASIASATTTITGIGICGGLPFLTIFGWLANRNRHALREEKKHREVLSVQQQNAQAIQQMAAQNAALHQQLLVQQQRPSQPALPTPSGDVRGQLELAREMIQDKNYTGARKLLRTINHPKATEWLQKLDQMNV